MQALEQLRTFKKEYFMQAYKNVLPTHKIEKLIAQFNQTQFEPLERAFEKMVKEADNPGGRMPGLNSIASALHKDLVEEIDKNRLEAEKV